MKNLVRLKVLFVQKYVRTGLKGLLVNFLMCSVKKFFISTQNFSKMDEFLSSWDTPR